MHSSQTAVYWAELCGCCMVTVPSCGLVYKIHLVCDGSQNSLPKSSHNYITGVYMHSMGNVLALLLFWQKVGHVLFQILKLECEIFVYRMLSNIECLYLPHRESNIIPFPNVQGNMKCCCFVSQTLFSSFFET